MKCETMNGKSNVFHYLNMHKNERILVIADGAAFGSEIDRVMQLIGGKDQVVLYLPESFEWLILKAKVVKANGQIRCWKSRGNMWKAKHILAGSGFYGSFD